MTPRTRKIVFLLVVSGTTLVLDQVTKVWAVGRLSTERQVRTHPVCEENGPVELREVRRPAEPVVVVEDHLTLRYVENCGGAWGLLSSTSEGFRYPFFLVVSVAAMLFILSLYRKVPDGQWMLRWALPLVLGGALGNFVDRLHMRHVVDFVLWHVTESFDWPTFNIADVGISVGVALLALDMVVGKREQVGEEKPDTETGTSTSTTEEPENREPGAGTE